MGRPDAAEGLIVAGTVGVRVVGLWRAPDGTPASGTVTVTELAGSPPMWRSGEPVTVTLDEGRLSAVVAPGWVRVTVRLEGCAPHAHERLVAGPGPVCITPGVEPVLPPGSDPAAPPLLGTEVFVGDGDPRASTDGYHPATSLYVDRETGRAYATMED